MRQASVAAIGVASVLAVSAVAHAEPQPQAQQSQQAAQAAATDNQVQSIGVSVDRIRRLLRETPPAQTSSTLKLEYRIEVVGRAPKIDVFRDFNVYKLSGVQYGGMTHAEFLKIAAPPWRKW